MCASLTTNPRDQNLNTDRRHRPVRVSGVVDPICWAVAFSWTFANFSVVVPGALAALALTFAHYLASAIPGWESGGFEAAVDWRVKMAACGAVLVVIGLNCMSAAQGGSVAKVFLTATLSGCVFVVLLGVVFACGIGVSGGSDEIDGSSSSGGSGGDASPPVPPFIAHAHPYPATDPRSVAAHNFSPSKLFEGTKGVASLGVGLLSALWWGVPRRLISAFAPSVRFHSKRVKVHGCANPQYEW